MFMSDVGRKEECKNAALSNLRKFGIKFRPKKAKTQPIKKTSRVFKVPLERLVTQTVTLRTGQQISVPRVVHELCLKILEDVDTEGIFRKTGSKKRQNEIQAMIDNGHPLDPDWDVIDLAAVLKVFLRELPEPLIPTSYHELFLRCAIMDKWRLEAILLACLLLPLDHLNTLAYLMQFLNEVAAHAESNKMTPYNLAVVIGPNIMPFEATTTPQFKQRTLKICEVIELLIENADSVGVLPDDIIDRVGSNTNKTMPTSSSVLTKSEESTKKKPKKRRSGSLTRMFNGFKKMVGGKIPEEDSNSVTPDLLMTPVNSMKKRKVQTSGLSQKRKRDVINNLPENQLLKTPFTPMRTPISMNLSGSPETNEKHVNKERRWFGRSRSVKNLPQETKTVPKNPERRWSGSLVRSRPTTPEPDYIRVPKIEYEDIKNRVSAMERRISIELDGKQSPKPESKLNQVQSAYEQTLSQSKLSPTTDHLARRLSKELKIRKSGDVIRSPSARKIGSLRRRSREIDHQSKLKRHQSWHASPQTVPTKRPNSRLSCNMSSGSTDTWTSAENFFTTLQSSNESTSSNDRASIAKIRSQNAGMVLAKAKLFDQVTASSENLRIPRPKVVPPKDRVRVLKYEEKKFYRKSVSPRKRNNGHLKQKVQMAKLHLEQSQSSDTSDKENSSHARSNVTLKRVAAASSTPYTPHIKRSIVNVRSPKRLCRTPGLDRGTPLRAIRSVPRNQ